MLTSKVMPVSQAGSYYTRNFYQSEQTRWWGKGAENLGLSGEIENRKVFKNLCNGLSPDGSQNLGSKTGRKRKRAGLDCTFSAPKSISLTALVGGDKRIIEAHRKAVEEALSLIQDECVRTRIWKDAKQQRVKTGNLVIAQFEHTESRELDPHVHTHCLIMNLTQAENGKWYALSTEEIHKNKKTLGAIYQWHLAYQLHKLGYEMENREHGQFEIRNYNRDEIMEFSTRRKQILEMVGNNASWRDREKAFMITRRPKEFKPIGELLGRWKQKAKQMGLEIPKPQQIQKSKSSERSKSKKQVKTKEIEWEL